MIRAWSNLILLFKQASGVRRAGCCLLLNVGVQTAGVNRPERPEKIGCELYNS